MLKCCLGCIFSSVFSNKEHTMPEERKWPKWKFAENFQEETKPCFGLFPHGCLHLYPRGQKEMMKSWRQWMQGRGGRGRDKHSWFLCGWEPFLFSPSFPCSFPSHSLQLVHQNVIWWKKNPEQALPPLHQMLLIERSSDMDPEGFFFLILNPDSPTRKDRHLIIWGNTFQGWNCCGCFPKYYPKEEELVMEDYALKSIF